MDEYQLYATIGIAAAGFVAGEIINYRNRKEVENCMQRLKGLAIKAEQAKGLVIKTEQAIELTNREFQGLFEKLDNLEGKN